MKGWDGFQLGKGQGEFTVQAEGPGVDQVLGVSKQRVISCAGQLIRSVNHRLLDVL